MGNMTDYRIQEWPDMPGDGGEGDAIIFSSDWPTEDWERHKSSTVAWLWLEGNTNPGDTIEVLPPEPGTRSDDYAGP